jgi:hypothetical protein
MLAALTLDLGPPMVALCPTFRLSGGGKMETSKVGTRGTVVVPARLRRKFGIEEG